MWTFFYSTNIISLCSFVSLGDNLCDKKNHITTKELEVLYKVTQRGKN